MKQPCKRDCPDRSKDCAANCLKWKVYVAWRNKQYEARSKELEMYEYLYDGKLKAAHKNYLRRKK